MARQPTTAAACRSCEGQEVRTISTLKAIRNSRSAPLTPCRQPVERELLAGAVAGVGISWAVGRSSASRARGRPSSRSAPRVRAHPPGRSASRPRAPARRAGAEPPSDFAAWARTGQASSLQRPRQDGTPAAAERPSARAAVIRTSTSRRSAAGAASAGAPRRVAGEAERPRHWRRARPRGRSGRCRRACRGRAKGPTRGCWRIVPTAQGTPSRSMIRSGGRRGGERRAPRIRISAARGVGGRGREAGSRRRGGRRGPHRPGAGDDLPRRDRGQPGPGQQQRGAGASGRAAGAEPAVEVARAGRERRAARLSTAWSVAGRSAASTLARSTSAVLLRTVPSARRSSLRSPLVRATR